MNDGIRVARPPEMIGAEAVKRTKGGAVQFSTHGTVAVVGGKWLGSQFPRNAATQTSSFIHDFSLLKIRCETKHLAKTVKSLPGETYDTLSIVSHGCGVTLMNAIPSFLAYRRLSITGYSQTN